MMEPMKNRLSDLVISLYYSEEIQTRLHINPNTNMDKTQQHFASNISAKLERLKSANIPNFTNYDIALSIFYFCLIIVDYVGFLTILKEIYSPLCVSVCTCMHMSCIYAHVHGKTTQLCAEIRDKLPHVILQQLSILFSETDSLWPWAHRLVD